MNIISAVYEQGVFRPTQPVDLPENSAVELRVSLSAHAANPAANGDNRSIEAKIAKLAAQVPADQWNRSPADLSDNLDHYIYGTPKQ